MSERLDSIDPAVRLLKALESIVLGLRQLREFVDGGIAEEMVDLLIKEAETSIDQAKRNVAL